MVMVIFIVMVIVTVMVKIISIVIGFSTGIVAPLTASTH